MNIIAQDFIDKLDEEGLDGVELSIFTRIHPGSPPFETRVLRVRHADVATIDTHTYGSTYGVPFTIAVRKISIHPGTSWQTASRIFAAAQALGIPVE